ncbi:hypothetical protein, partial [Rhodopila globiformis]|uniref:hypothetical protein n=1 Tax=Rhodopila globiformis TaxID=1071 RepID=UPI0018759304
MTLAERVNDLNRWYEALPESRRILVYPAVLVAAGVIDTHRTGAPFGMVFLAALVLLFALRRSYIAGWFKQSAAAGPAGALEHQRTVEPPAAKAPAAKEPPPAAPAAKPEPAAEAARPQPVPPP